MPFIRIFIAYFFFIILSFIIFLFVSPFLARKSKMITLVNVNLYNLEMQKLFISDIRLINVNAQK